MAPSSQAEKKSWTWQDYLKIPDDGRLYEVIDGELLLRPTPVARHQFVLGGLATALAKHVDALHLGKVIMGPCDVILSDRNVVDPDVTFLSTERLGLIQDWIMGAPDLIVEIIGEETSQRDTEVKFDLYARFGVPHYWILNPDERVLIAFRLADAKYERAALCQGDDHFQPELFEGLTIELGQVWSDL